MFWYLCYTSKGVIFYKKLKTEEHHIPNRPVCCTFWLVCSCGAPLFTGVPGAVEGTWPCMKFWLAWPAGNPGGRRLGIPEHKDFLISKYGKQDLKKKKRKNLQLDCDRKDTFESVLSHYKFRQKVFFANTWNPLKTFIVLMCAIILPNKLLWLSSNCNLNTKLTPQRRQKVHVRLLRNWSNIVRCFLLYCISTLIRPLTYSMHANTSNLHLLPWCAPLNNSHHNTPGTRSLALLLCVRTLKNLHKSCSFK